MKRIVTIWLLTILITSCQEDFQRIDPSEFNNAIAMRSDISSAKQLVEIYYDYPKNEGTPNLTIEEKKLSDENIEVTLIHDGLEDDSQRAIKIVLTAQLKNNKWTVLEIKKNHKCWEGRGHTSWGTEWCN